MNFHFDKYHGAGNDFIIIDDRDILFPDNEHQFIKKLCDRHFGVGANGFILLRKSKVADFKMIYYNSDGHPSSLCGNGSRCVFLLPKNTVLLEKPDPLKPLTVFTMPLQTAMA